MAGSFSERPGIYVSSDVGLLESFGECKLL